MTRIKLCGLTRMEDIEAANRLLPGYVGFVFAKRSRRCVSPAQAAELKKRLDKRIKAAGVFVDEKISTIAELAEKGVIDIIQLHGSEDEEYISALRRRTDKPIIKAFVISSSDDAAKAERSGADYILLDGGRGEGTPFEWEVLDRIEREYFLAGGLNAENVGAAVRKLRPFAVDVSSGIETDGLKDYNKMEAFIKAVRKEDKDD